MEVEVTPNFRGSDVSTTISSPPNSGYDLGRHGRRPLCSFGIELTGVVLRHKGEDLGWHMLSTSLNITALGFGLHAAYNNQVLAHGMAGMSIHGVGSAVHEDPLKGRQGKNPDLLDRCGFGVVIDAGHHVDVEGGIILGRHHDGADVGSSVRHPIRETKGFLSKPIPGLYVVNVDISQGDLARR